MGGGEGGVANVDLTQPNMYENEATVHAQTEYKCE